MRGLVSLDCSRIFSESFSKRNGFIFLLPASQTCSVPRQDFCVPSLLASHVKYYLNSQNFPPFKTLREKLGNDDVNLACVL